MNPKVTGLPPVTGNRHVWDWPAIHRLIEEANGEWVHLNPDGPVSTSIYYALKRGNMKAMRPVEKFEFITRKNTPPPNRTCDIYVRLNPEYKENHS